MHNKIRLWYYPVDGGDGSVYMRFFKTQEQAKKLEAEEEDQGQGWGESCVGYVDLDINADGSFLIDGK